MEICGNSKFQQVMNKLLDPDFIVSYDHLNSIFTYITEKYHNIGKLIIIARNIKYFVFYYQ